MLPDAIFLAPTDTSLIYLQYGAGGDWGELDCGKIYCTGANYPWDVKEIFRKSLSLGACGKSPHSSEKQLWVTFSRPVVGEKSTVTGNNAELTIPSHAVW